MHDFSVSPVQGPVKNNQLDQKHSISPTRKGNDINIAKQCELTKMYHYGSSKCKLENAPRISLKIMSVINKILSSKIYPI